MIKKHYAVASLIGATLAWLTAVYAFRRLSFSAEFKDSNSACQGSLLLENGEKHLLDFGHVQVKYPRSKD